MRNLLIGAALVCTAIASDASAGQAGGVVQNVICTAETRQTSGWRLTQVAFYTAVHKVKYKPNILADLTRSWKERLARAGYTQTPGTYAGCHLYTEGAPLGGIVAPNPTKLDWSPPTESLP